MLALTILLFILVAAVIVVIAVLAVFNMLNLIPALVPLVPLGLAIGAGLLCLIEMLLLFGTKEDKRTAAVELIWLFGTCAASAFIFWFASSLLWQ